MEEVGTDQLILIGSDGREDCFGEDVRAELLGFQIAERSIVAFRTPD